MARGVICMIDINDLRVNFESKVLASKRVILVPHTIADFDAIGSSIGLSLAISKLKRPSMIIVDDKPYELDSGVQSIIRETKQDFNIVSKNKYLGKGETSVDDDLFIMTDVNKSYLVTMSDLMRDPENVMIIDHHNTDKSTVDSNYKYIDSTSISSVSEIVTKLLISMKVKIPQNVANYLLAGIYLDTAKMTAKIGEDTFYIAHKLKKDYNADINYVMDLFTEDIESDRKVQELISRTQMIVYKIAMSLADPEVEYTYKELARVADNGLSYGADASFAVGKVADDIVRVSARSKSKVDVGGFMSQFDDGGGNPCSGAANFHDLSIEDVGKKLELSLRPSCYVEKKTD